MNKQQLIAALEKLPDDTVILVAGDEEWNSLHELYEITPVAAMTDHFEWQAIHSEDTGNYEDEQMLNAAVLWG